MHGSAVVSMCQKLPWGKTSLWGVWVYGNIYFCNKIKLHLWWNSSCPKVSAYTKLECRYLVCRYLRSKGVNPTLAICGLAWRPPPSSFSGIFIRRHWIWVVPYVCLLLASPGEPGHGKTALPESWPRAAQLLLPRMEVHWCVENQNWEEQAHISLTLGQ